MLFVMKTKDLISIATHQSITLLLASALALTALLIHSSAQEESFGPGTGGNSEMRCPPNRKDPRPGRGQFGLSQEEREILRSAHEKIRNDAELENLRKSILTEKEKLRTQTRQALIKADPRVEAILDKIERPSGEQAQRFRHVMGEIKHDPAVQAARAKMRAARTPEEKRVAGEELREIVKKAVAKIDPALAEQMPPIPPMHGPRMGPGRGPDRGTY